jgi:hypothetical protein
MTTQVLIIAIQNAVDRREIGTATASVNLFRALGGSMGVAIYGAIFAAGLRHWLPRQLPGEVGGVDARGIQAGPDRIRALSATVQHGVAVSVSDALHLVFLSAAIVAAVGLLVVLYLRERPYGRRHHERDPAAWSALCRGRATRRHRRIGRHDRGQLHPCRAARLRARQGPVAGPLWHGQLVTSSLVWDDVHVREYGNPAVSIGRHTQQATYRGQPSDGSFALPIWRSRSTGSGSLPACS